MRILMVTPEANPFARSGGLAMRCDAAATPPADEENGDFT